MLDYDDLLLQWWALLRTPSVGPLVAEQVRHVLVDEVQDTNALQGDLLAELAGLGATLTAVGDDAQAIYGFRAATVRNILDFPTRYGADVVTLTRNHRSTPEVLAAANAVMADATERLPKELRAERSSGARPRLVTAHDEHAQAVGVCEAVLERMDAGLPLRHQAVLFRTSHHSQVLQVELTVRSIPFTLYGGLKFLEAAHVKDLVCALRLVENPADALAWFRVLQLIDGIGPAAARAATEQVRNGESVDHPGVGPLLDALTAARAPSLREVPGAQVAQVRTLARCPGRAPPSERGRPPGGPRSPRAGGRHGAHPRAVPHGPHARSPRLHRRPRRSAPPRRRLPHPLHHPLGQGSGVGRRAPHPPRGRMPPVGHGHGPSGGDRGGATPPARRHDASAATTCGSTSLCATTITARTARGRDAHGYAQRSRFLSEAVIAECDEMITAPPATADAPVALDDAPAVAEVRDFLAGLLA